jgi:hypothetical protein
MEVPAKKIDCCFEQLNYKTAKKTLNTRYGEEHNGYFKGISYYTVHQHVKDTVLKIIPEPYKKCFDVFLMIINRTEIPPHIDSNTLVAINMYLKTNGNSVTTFWDNPVKEQTNSTQIENQTDGCILDYKNLVENYSFIAKENETWVLNVKMPHSVKCEEDNFRIAFTIQSSTISYEQTLKMFNL